MPHTNDSHDYTFPTGPFAGWNRSRLLLVVGGAAVLLLILLLMVWNIFFKYVPPGQHLVITAKNGTPIDPEVQVLANPGQKGVQADVLGEGWHFIMPVVNSTELESNTVIPAGKVGVVTALGGRPLPDDRELAEEGERGMQRNVRPPGAYRINLHGYKVDVVDATEIRPGFVGVVRRLLRTREPDLFGADGSRRGYLSKVLQPGLYYLNTKEFEVLKSEVGIYQTSFRARDNEHTQDTAITFPCKGGFSISLDCTIEWEVLPEHMPSIVREYGSRHEVDKKVIDVQAHAIARDKGFDYTAQDLLEGTTRQKFQEDFTQGLRTACAAKNVTIHSAFIRRIDIPDEYLKPIRDRQIAAETEITAKAKEVTAETENDVEREQRRIQQAVAKVEAETKQKVANIEQQVDNVQVRTDAELEKLQSEFTKRITTLDSERNQLLGQAKADAEKLVKTATSSLYQMKMDVFKNDGDAFLRYTLADNLNPNLVLRLFHSGSGTFWTNMGNKNMNFLMPIAPAGESKPKAAGVSADNAAEKDLEPKSRAQKGTE